MKVTKLSTEEYREALSERYRMICGDKGITSAHLARISGLSKQYLYQLEKAKTLPGLDIMLFMSVSLDVSIDWFLRGRGNMYVTDVPPNKEMVPDCHDCEARVQHLEGMVAAYENMILKIAGKSRQVDVAGAEETHV